MRVTIYVKNLDAVTRKLDQINRGAYLADVGRAAGTVIRNEMRRYPPPPPNSTYRRTGTLGKSWNVTNMRGGKQGGWVSQIGTRLNYAPYVQDATRQAQVHQGRWQTIQDVAQDKRDEVVNFVVKAIRRMLMTWGKG